MSKFTIKVKLQGLEIEVEGTREDAPRIANQLGKQIGGLLQAPASLASGNGNVIEAEVSNEDGAGKKSKKAKKSGGGGTKTAFEPLNFVLDSSQYGSPQQSWTTTQKAIWLLYVAEKQAGVTQLTAYGITKNFNHQFKSAGQINSGNVMTGLDKEKLKGPNSTVGTDVTDGTAKYFLTTAGKTLAAKLAKGEAVATD